MVARKNITIFFTTNCHHSTPNIYFQDLLFSFQIYMMWNKLIFYPRWWHVSKSLEILTSGQPGGSWTFEPSSRLSSAHNIWVDKEPEIMYSRGRETCTWYLFEMTSKLQISPKSVDLFVGCIDQVHERRMQGPFGVVWRGRIFRYILISS